MRPSSEWTTRVRKRLPRRPWIRRLELPLSSSKEIMSCGLKSVKAWWEPIPFGYKFAGLYSWLPRFLTKMKGTFSTKLSLNESGEEWESISRGLTNMHCILIPRHRNRTHLLGLRTDSTVQLIVVCKLRVGCTFDNEKWWVKVGDFDSYYCHGPVRKIRWRAGSHQSQAHPLPKLR